MTNFSNYLKALNYLEVYDNGVVYRKERTWNNNGGTQTQPRKLCPQTIDGSGYSNISIYLNGRHFSPKVHLLVMLKYKGLPESEDMQVDHIDGNKQNNSISNLEWVTASKNVKRAFDTGLNKITETQKEERHNRMLRNNPMKNPEVSAKVSEWHKGQKMAEETKAKISATTKGKSKSIETRIKMGKAVYAYKDGVLKMSYISAREAGKDGFNRQAISKSIKENKEYKGYYWSYDND